MPRHPDEGQTPFITSFFFTLRLLPSNSIFDVYPGSRGTTASKRNSHVFHTRSLNVATNLSRSQQFENHDRRSRPEATKRVVSIKQNQGKQTKTCKRSRAPPSLPSDSHPALKMSSSGRIDHVTPPIDGDWRTRPAVPSLSIDRRTNRCVPLSASGTETVAARRVACSCRNVRCVG